MPERMRVPLALRVNRNVDDSLRESCSHARPPLAVGLSVLLLLAAWGAGFGYLLNLRVAIRRENERLRWRAMLLRAVCLQRWTLN